MVKGSSSTNAISTNTISIPNSTSTATTTPVSITPSPSYLTVQNPIAYNQHQYLSSMSNSPQLVRRVLKTGCDKVTKTTIMRHRTYRHRDMHLAARRSARRTTSVNNASSWANKWLRQSRRRPEALPATAVAGWANSVRVRQQKQ